MYKFVTKRNINMNQQIGISPFRRQSTSLLRRLSGRTWGSLCRPLASAHGRWAWNQPWKFILKYSIIYIRKAALLFYFWSKCCWKYSQTCGNDHLRTTTSLISSFPKFLMKNLWTMTTFEQWPLFLSLKGGGSIQVWLNYVCKIEIKCIPIFPCISFLAVIWKSAVCLNF